MRIVYAYADNKPDNYLCSNWLCSFPATALDRAGYRVALVPVADFVEEDMGADLYIVERLLWNGTDPVKYDRMPDGPRRRSLLSLANLRVLDKIEELQGRGKKVAAVIDDHYDAYPDTLEASEGAKLWLKGRLRGHFIGFVPIEHFKQGLQLVDAVLSPSQFILDHYAPEGKGYLVRNRPLLEHWQKLGVSPRGPGRVRLGWSGTLQHVDSWKDNPILDALALLKDHVVLVGATGSQEIVSMIEGRGVEYRNVGPVPFYDFPGVVASYDVGICPLGGEYDKGRSWIKWLECSLAGKPVVATDHFGVYNECEGGFLVSETQEWLEALVLLMENEVAYATESAKGRAWAWAQGWDENLGELIDVFEAILDD